MYCGSCGQVVTRTDKFCQACGEAVEWGPERTQTITPRKMDFNTKKLAAKINTPLKKMFVALGLLLVLFFLSIPVYNSLNSPENLVKDVQTAIEKQDGAKLESLLETTGGEKLTPAALQLFMDYYGQNPGLEQYVEASGYYTHETFLGYKYYSLAVPTDVVSVQTIEGVILEVAGSEELIVATGGMQDLGSFAAGIPVSVAATYQTNWGDVTEEKRIEPGNPTEFEFADAVYYYLDVDYLPPGLPVLINGQDSGQVIWDDYYGRDMKIGPLPPNQEYVFTATSAEPFGDFVYYNSSAEFSPGSTITLIADLDASYQILQDVAEVIHRFNAAIVNPLESAADYMAPSAYSNPADFDQYQYLNMILHGETVLLDTIDGQSVMKVSDTEWFDLGFGPEKASWRYTMMWNDELKKWQVYSWNELYYEPLVDGTYDIELTNEYADDLE